MTVTLLNYEHSETNKKLQFPCLKVFFLIQFEGVRQMVLYAVQIVKSPEDNLWYSTM